MSIEMTDMQKPADQRQASDKLLLVGNLISSVVENPTQEVGTVIDLPRIYSTFDILFFLNFIGLVVLRILL